MDNQPEFVPNGDFLDLGCCPGGFSTYVLHKWPKARGVGVSLPVELGGHSLAVPMKLRDRLEVHWGDITMFDLAPSLTRGLPENSAAMLLPIPWSPHSFDFVIADGHQHPEMFDKDRKLWSKDRLLLSQLLVALRAVKSSGTLFLKLSLRASTRLTDRIALALCRLTSFPLRAVKPTSIYASKATFYIIVQSLDLERCDHLVRVLEGLWYFMTFDGPHGIGRGLTENDMNEIAPYSDVAAARSELDALFAPIKEIQSMAKPNEAQTN